MPGRLLLAPTGWVRPDGAACPSGGDWAEHYLQPLADALDDRVPCGTHVTGEVRPRDRPAGVLMPLPASGDGSSRP